MGGGTGKIGDPSFKDEARKLLTDEVIAANVASIKTVFERFLTLRDGRDRRGHARQCEWLDKLEYIPFLREVGQHFSVNRCSASIRSSSGSIANNRCRSLNSTT